MFPPRPHLGEGKGNRRLLAAAGPTAHFDRNESHAIYGTEH
jgi:hypothetical protein